MPAKAKKDKFKKRYVLGEGYPWAMGTGPYKEIALAKEPQGLQFDELEFPKELWSKEVPKYRIVLEKL